jgi:hypothetical protein
MFFKSEVLVLGEEEYVATLETKGEQHGLLRSGIRDRWTQVKLPDSRVIIRSWNEMSAGKRRT